LPLTTNPSDLQRRPSCGSSTGSADSADSTSHPRGAIGSRPPQRPPQLPYRPQQWFVAPRRPCRSGRAASPARPSCRSCLLRGPCCSSASGTSCRPSSSMVSALDPRTPAPRRRVLHSVRTSPSPTGVQASAAGIAVTLIVDVVKGLVSARRGSGAAAGGPRRGATRRHLVAPPATARLARPPAAARRRAAPQPLTQPPSPPRLLQQDRVVRMRMLRCRMFLGVGAPACDGHPAPAAPAHTHGHPHQLAAARAAALLRQWLPPPRGPPSQRPPLPGPHQAPRAPAPQAWMTGLYMGGTEYLPPPQVRGASGPQIKVDGAAVLCSPGGSSPGGRSPGGSSSPGGVGARRCRLRWPAAAQPLHSRCMAAASLAPRP
jgi:hypothetical protein